MNQLVLEQTQLGAAWPPPHELGVLGAAPLLTPGNVRCPALHSHDPANTLGCQITTSFLVFLGINSLNDTKQNNELV